MELSGGSSAFAVRSGRIRRATRAQAWACKGAAYSPAAGDWRNYFEANFSGLSNRQDLDMGVGLHACYTSNDLIETFI